jgi:hypothetical protein
VLDEPQPKTPSRGLLLELESSQLYTPRDSSLDPTRGSALDSVICITCYYIEIYSEKIENVVTLIF